MFDVIVFGGGGDVSVVSGGGNGGGGGGASDGVVVVVVVGPGVDVTASATAVVLPSRQLYMATRRDKA